MYFKKLLKNFRTKHHWHLVDPSPWLLVVSVAAFSVNTKGVFYMHNYLLDSSVFNFGFCLLIFVMYVWWRDVVREATLEEQHNFAVQIGLRLGMVLPEISLKVYRGENYDCIFFTKRNAQDASEQKTILEERSRQIERDSRQFFAEMEDIYDRSSFLEHLRRTAGRAYVDRLEQERFEERAREARWGVRDYFDNEPTRVAEFVRNNLNDTVSVPDSINLGSSVGNIDPSVLSSLPASARIPADLELPDDLNIRINYTGSLTNEPYIVSVTSNSGIDESSLLTVEEQESSTMLNNTVGDSISSIDSSTSYASLENVSISSASSLTSISTRYCYSEDSQEYVESDSSTRLDNLSISSSNKSAVSVSENAGESQLEGLSNNGSDSESLYELTKSLVDICLNKGC